MAGPGRFDPDRSYENLKIPLKYIVQYWWNNIADQEAVLQDVLEDVLTVYKDRMLPDRPEEVPFDTSDALDELREAV